MAEPAGAPPLPPGNSALLQQKKRRWLIRIWLCGALLAIAIVTGLGSTLSRLERTMKLIDDATLTDEAYKKIEQRTLRGAKLGLAVGTLAFFGYLYCLVMHHRTKQQIQAARDEERHFAILEEMLDDEEDDQDPSSAESERS